MTDPLQPQVYPAGFVKYNIAPFVKEHIANEEQIVYTPEIAICQCRRAGRFRAFRIPAI